MWWNKNTPSFSDRCFIPPSPPQKLVKKSWPTKTIYAFNTNQKFLKESKEELPEYEEFPTNGTKKRKRLKHTLTKKEKKKRKKKENVKKNSNLRTLKVRIFPNKEQKKILKKWVGTGRYIYNKSIDEINNNNGKKNETIKKLNGHQKKCDFVIENPWLTETPSHIKTSAIRDAFKAKKTCFSLLNAGKIKKFELKYRKKRNTSSIVITKGSIKKVGRKFLIYQKRAFGKLGNLKIRSKKAKSLISKGLKHEPRILLDKNKKYWLLISYKNNKCRIESQNPNKKLEIVALDPGVRTFQAFYCPNGVCGEIVKGDFGRIYRLSKHLDNLQSRMTKVKSRKRYRMKKAFKRLITRIKNLVNRVHKETAKFLTSTFRYILLPKFETSKMVNKKNRKIKSKVARGLMTWVHYRFKMWLRYVCKKTGTNLIEVTEEYTSKTCGKCGKLNSNLKGSKTFVCPNCSFKLDRDLNGARNIFLKFWSSSDIRSVVIKPPCLISGMH